MSHSEREDESDNRNNSSRWTRGGGVVREREREGVKGGSKEHTAAHSER